MVGAIKGPLLCLEQGSKKKIGEEHERKNRVERKWEIKKKGKDKKENKKQKKDNTVGMH